MSVNLSILLIMIGCAIVTVIPRVLPFIMLRGIKMPDKLIQWLSYIPVCIFTALIVDSMIQQSSAGLTIDWEVVFAILPTLLVAILTKSLSLTVIVGVITMAVIRLFNLF